MIRRNFSVFLILTAIPAFFLACCTTTSCASAGSSLPAYQAVPPPSTFSDPSSHPIPLAVNYWERGRASWYGAQFHGRKTANGEVFDMFAMTAAHKTLPMNTLLQVRNLENGMKTLVRVNDRGPFVEDRIIDLSYSAANKIGMLDDGVTPIEVIVLGETALPDASIHPQAAGAPIIPAGATDPLATTAGSGLVDEDGLQIVAGKTARLSADFPEERPVLRDAPRAGWTLLDAFSSFSEFASRVIDHFTSEERPALAMHVCHDEAYGSGHSADLPAHAPRENVPREVGKMAPRDKHGFRQPCIGMA